MNKRLLHLFNEAGFHQPEMERMGLEYKFEKFAELIVQECMNVLYDNELYNRHISNALTEHFGVEE